VLNDSDNLNTWRPSETYPVALGWARALGEAAPEPRERSIALLREWVAGGTEVSADRVDECIQMLRDNQVLREDGTFQLPMLERFLRVRASRGQPIIEPREREALHRLGLPRIERPSAEEDGAQEDFQGGQARVYRAQDGGKDIAVRCVRLEDESAQLRFQREVRLLQRISTLPIQNYWQALRGLPHLIRAGIDAADPRQGVVLYEWVRGEPLARESLSEVAALTVGARLATVLRALEELQVVHRDIKPENVLVRAEDWEPVLIDFGLVRAVEELRRGSNTVAGTAGYTPPEVLAGQPWDTRADLFALGRTLEECLARTAAAPRLRELLKRMTAEQARG
ncbi:MAG: protein kinase, partial [Myxococcaceae bacterium]|nr:protein kinase [Myxococcaceae bacterium]